MKLSLVAGWALAVGDEHPPAIADLSKPWILDRDGICHVRVEREATCSWVEGIWTARFNDVDAPAPVDAVHIAHVEPPGPTITEDRASLDGRAAEVFARGAPDRLEALAISARYSELAAPCRPWPANAIDEINGVAVAEGSRSSGPVARSDTGRVFDDDGGSELQGHVHSPANSSRAGSTS